MVYSKYNRRRFEDEKPVNEGETYDIEIEATGAKGDGIGKIKGFVVIIPNAKPGQKVKVKIDAVRGKVAFGSVVGEADAVPAAEEASEEAAEEAPADETQEEEASEEEKKEESEVPAEEAAEEPASEEAAEEPEASEEEKKE